VTAKDVPTGKVTSEPPATKTTKTEPNLAQQYVDANKPQQTVKPEQQPVKQKPQQQPVKQKPELTVGTPEYDARMEKLQTAAGEKFSKERQARLDKDQQEKSKLSIAPPKSDPEADPKAWQDYDRRMEKLQTAAGDKFSKEYQATEKIPPEDDSYFTKFKNLFK
jgi:hypothetical protein